MTDYPPPQPPPRRPWRLWETALLLMSGAAIVALFSLAITQDRSRISAALAQATATAAAVVVEAASVAVAQAPGDAVAAATESADAAAPAAAAPTAAAASIDELLNALDAPAEPLSTEPAQPSVEPNVAPAAGEAPVPSPVRTSPEQTVSATGADVVEGVSPTEPASSATVQSVSTTASDDAPNGSAQAVAAVAASDDGTPTAAASTTSRLQLPTPTAIATLAEPKPPTPSIERAVADAATDEPSVVEPISGPLALQPTGAPARTATSLRTDAAISPTLAAGSFVNALRPTPTPGVRAAFSAVAVADTLEVTPQSLSDPNATATVTATLPTSASGPPTQSSQIALAPAPGWTETVSATQTITGAVPPPSTTESAKPITTTQILSAAVVATAPLAESEYAQETPAVSSVVTSADLPAASPTPTEPQPTATATATAMATSTATPVPMETPTVAPTATAAFCASGTGGELPSGAKHYGGPIVAYDQERRLLVTLTVDGAPLDDVGADRLNLYLSDGAQFRRIVEEAQQPREHHIEAGVRTGDAPPTLNAAIGRPVGEFFVTVVNDTGAAVRFCMMIENGALR